MTKVFNPIVKFGFDESGDTSILDTRYLKLDASNDPITGALLLQPTSDVVPLTIDGISGITNHLQDWKINNASPVSYINNAGLLTTIQDTGGVVIGDTKALSVFDAVYGIYYSNVTFQPVVTNQDVVFRFMPSGTADSGVMEWYNSHHNLATNDYRRVVFKSFDGSSGFWIWSHTFPTSDYTNTMPIKIMVGGNTPMIFTNTNPCLIAIGVNNTDPLGKVDIKGHGNIIQLRMRAFAGMTASQQEWQTSGGALLTKVEEDGEIDIVQDSKYFRWGAGYDAGITYDGTNMLVVPDLVGTGYVQISTAQALALVVGKGTAGIDYQLKFDGETNDGLITWMEDEDYFQFDDDILLLDSEALKLGTGADATLLYDGTNLLLNPKAVGTGYFNVQGKILVDTEVEIDGDLNHDGSNIGFFGTAPTTKQTALTTQLTAVTFTAPGTPDYAFQDVTNSTPYGFTDAEELRTFISVVSNLQTRVAELETKLQAYGLLA